MPGPQPNGATGRTTPSTPILGAADDLVWGLFRQRPLERSWCRPSETPRYLIALPRTCGIVEWRSGQRFCSSPNAAVLYTPGLAYERRHFGWAEEETAFIAFCEDSLRRASRRLGASRTEAAAVFAAGSSPLSGDAYFHHAKLWTAAGAGRIDATEMSRGVEALLHEVLLSGLRARERGRARTPDALAAKIDNVREAIGTESDEPSDLASLADLVGLSPAYLSRTFHQVVGLPLSKYRERVRLGRAVRRLAEPGASLAAIAIDLGYSSQAHFTAAFRGSLGGTPGELARLARKNLIDPRRAVE